MDTVFRFADSDFARATRAFERGDLDTLASLRKPTSAKFDQDLATRLVTHLLERKWSDNNACDGWFAPRVHSILRLPRRIAADKGVWFWLATTAFKPYVEWRFERAKPDAPWWRYNGELLRNAVSRLWWGAEMVRSGPDYTLVPSAFRTVRTYMFVSELRYSWYREAARAFTRVATGVDGSPPLSDEVIQRLSVLFNTYLSLDVLESHGVLAAPSTKPEWDGPWGEASPTWLELTGDVTNVVGPDSGYSESTREGALVDWLERIAQGIGVEHRPDGALANA